MSLLVVACGKLVRVQLLCLKASTPLDETIPTHELMEAKRKLAAHADDRALQTQVLALQHKIKETATAKKQKLVEVFKVPQKAIQLLLDKAANDPDYAKQLKTSALWSGSIHLRSSCSGLGAAETASKMVAAACAMRKVGGGRPLEVLWVGACEKDHHQREFLKKQKPHNSEFHVHQNILHQKRLCEKSRRLSSHKNSRSKQSNASYLTPNSWWAARAIVIISRLANEWGVTSKYRGRHA